MRPTFTGLLREKLVSIFLEMNTKLLESNGFLRQHTRALLTSPPAFRIPVFLHPGSLVFQPAIVPALLEI